MTQIIDEDASTDENEKFVNPLRRLTDYELDDLKEEGKRLRDPKSRLTLGQHEDLRIQHGVRVVRKACIKQSAKARKFGKKPELPEALHRKLFSDDAGPLSLYDGFKLSRRERAQRRLLKKARASGRAVGQLQVA